MVNLLFLLFFQARADLISPPFFLSLQTAITRLNSSSSDHDLLKAKQAELDGALVRLTEMEQSLTKLRELEHRVAQLEQELNQSHESGFAVRAELEKQKRISTDHINVLKETLKSSENEVVALDGLLAHVRDVLVRNSTSLTNSELTKLLWEVGEEDESTKDLLPMVTN
jgi:DNA repair exonuclease SbcCD ATPase subunit